MIEEEFSERSKCLNCKNCETRGNKSFCKLNKEEKEVKKDDSCASFDDNKEEIKESMVTSYRNIIDILKQYLDLKEEYYNIIALWIIGTYFHNQFNSYPFLFFNAIKGSGKTRTLNLITTLAKDGEILLSPTEAVLFRTKGTLGIDEFEGITRKGIESVRELINAAYKKGAKVKRMKQKKSLDGGTEQVVEEFSVYRPIVMANIFGMENVLGDRCIQLILEKSSNKKMTHLVEIFAEENAVIETKKMLNQCSLCRCSFYGRVYIEWNEFVKNNYTNYTHYTHHTNYTNYSHAFKSLNLMDLNGRECELSLPLCLLASEISDDILKETTLTLSTIFNEKKSDEFYENKDVQLLEFVSQEPQQNNFKNIKQITSDFVGFSNSSEEWVNSKWIGRALKRMNLIKEKRRFSGGVQVILNVEKAINKIKIFKPVEKNEN